MKTASTKLKNATVVILLPVLVYLLFFLLSGGKFGKASSIIMNFKQTLVPTLISYAMCCNVLCNRMDLSAGAVVMLASMLGAKMVYLYGIGLVPFALIVVGAGVGARDYFWFGIYADACSCYCNSIGRLYDL